MISFHLSPINKKEHHEKHKKLLPVVPKWLVLVSALANAEQISGSRPKEKWVAGIQPMTPSDPGTALDLLWPR